MKLDIKKILPSLLIVLSGIFLGLSRQRIPLDFFAFFSFIPVFLYFSSLDSHGSAKDLIKKSVLNGTLYSFTFLLISVHWISLVTLGGFIGILFLYSFYYSVLFFIISLILKRNPNHLAQAVILGFICMEFVLSYGPFKFPWLNVGYSLAHYKYLIQCLEVGGVYLLSLLVLIVNFLLYKIIFFSSEHSRLKRNSYIIILFVLMLVWFFSGYIRYYQIDLKQSSTKVGIVQVSIPQELKWQAEFLDKTVQLYENNTKRLLKKEKLDLVIWPEAAVPTYLLIWPEYLRRMMIFTHKVQTNVFVGFPHFEEKIKYKQQPDPYLYYNSATQFKSNFEYDHVYYKTLLVPFGERTPFLEYFPILWKIQLGQANFEPGTEHQYYEVNGLTYSPLICYEIIFPDYIRTMQKKKTDFMINISNDAWFKKSIGTHQHKMITVYRAIESRRSIYRSTNTGYTMIINPKGDIIKEIGLFQQGAISSPVQIYEHLSFYHRIGFILPYILCFLFFLEIILTIFKMFNKSVLL